MRAGPADLEESYDLFRRIRADGRSASRPEARLQDWTDRATKLDREALRAAEAGERRLAAEYDVVLFAENGVGRAVVESLAGAEAAALTPEGGVGAAPGA